MINRQEGAFAMPRRLYSYLRFSSLEQKKGHSQERQMDLAAEILPELEAKYGPLLVDDSLHMDDEGLSAFRGRHLKVGALGDFCAAIDAKLVPPGSILVVEKLDRLSRQEISVAEELVKYILRAGVIIETCRPRRTYSAASLNDFLALLELLFAFHLAHEESVGKSERVGAAWRKKKRHARETGEAITQNCPAWLERDGKRFRPRKGAWETVQQIVQLAREGFGYSRILAWLREHPEEHPHIGQGARWNHSYIARILKSRALYGAYQPLRINGEGNRKVADGEIVEGYYPAIMTKPEWEAMQQTVKKRRKGSGRPSLAPTANLFTGLLNHCPSGMHYRLDTVRKPSGREIAYLRVPVEWRRAYPEATIPMDDVEEGLLAAMVELQPEDVSEGSEGAGRLAALTAEYEALTERVRSLEEALANPANPAAMLPSLLTAVQAATVRREEVRQQLVQAQQAAVAAQPERLGVVKTRIGQLREAATDRVAGLRARLKTDIGNLVEAVWIRVQKITQRGRIIHVQMWVIGCPQPRYFRILSGHVPEGTIPWSCAGEDFRVGRPAKTG
jgi:DNA invertase Pin-like site-specific DNA recombinase